MELVPVLPLLIMIYTDFRYRIINLLPLLVFVVTQIISSICYNGFLLSLQNLLINTLLMISVAILLLFYCKLRKVTIKEIIGIGDVFFIISLAPFFTIDKFLLFLISAFIVSILFWVFRQILKNKEKDIPLVSTVGTSYICYLILDFYRYGQYL
jgi:hypothetical protein